MKSVIVAPLFSVVTVITAIVMLHSCTTLWYDTKYDYKNPAFMGLKKTDTIAVLFLQYGDIPRYKLFVDTLYSLFALNTSHPTVRSDSVISTLINKHKVFTLPQNMTKEVLASIQPAVPCRYLMTIDVQNWVNFLNRQPDADNVDGSVQLRFCLFDMNDFTVQHSLISEMSISAGRQQHVYTVRSLFAVATELVHDTFHRNLLKAYSRKE